jgi:hypothetical protein
MNVSNAVQHEWKEQARIVSLKAQTALQNEQLTRQRVEGCETALGEVMQLLARDRWGRLKWLLTGK